MYYIVLDFETYDPWIKQGRGSGWPEKQAKFLCAVTHSPPSIDSGNIRQWTKIDELINYIKRMIKVHPDFAIVAHNAPYESGILHSYGFDIRSVTWIDTRLLAILYDNSLNSFSLDNLSKVYLNNNKTQDILGEVARALGLVKTIKQNAIQIAYDNMDKIYAFAPEVVLTYNQDDVILTHDLFAFLYRKMKDGGYFKVVNGSWEELVDYHSDLIKAFTLMRAKGINASKFRAQESKLILEEKYNSVMEEVTKHYTGNISSSQELSQYFVSQGLNLPKKEPTDKMLDKNPEHEGNFSVDKKVLEGLDHPVAKMIVEAKKLKKYIRDYLEPILSLPGDDIVRVYPNFLIYGAAATGRPTATEPNMLQIPKRDKDGYLIRRVYVPEEGEKWYSLDYAIQEPRLQLHFAMKTNDKSCLGLVEEFRKTPTTDLHHKVACMIHKRDVPKDGKERKDAKTINLGLSYGMGKAKLSRSLGVSEIVGESLLAQFHGSMPYIANLARYCEMYTRNKGYMTTIYKRRLQREKGFEYKSMNKLIQGSAADQTYAVVRQCYLEGISLMLDVYDEIDLSTSNIETALRVKEIMETVIKLEVPSVAELQVGDSWGELN